MAIVCPVCNKSNDETVSACSRCGCDVAVLAQISGAAHQAMHKAIAGLGMGEFANQSWQLKKSHRSAMTACLAALAIGKRDDAAAWLHRAHSVSAPQSP
jgi:hypothetical protein